MTETSKQPSQLTRLTDVDHECLGWTFRDRNLFLRRFIEPYPVMEQVPPRLIMRAESARRNVAGWAILSISVGLILAEYVAQMGGVLLQADDSSQAASYIGKGLLVFGGLLALAGFGGAGLVARGPARAKAELQRTALAIQQRNHHNAAVWAKRKADHEAAERARVDSYIEWGTVDPPAGTRRVDVIGGNTWGWEALLTVLGSSLLHTRGPLTLVDFSGEAACRELVRFAGETGVPHDVRVLPSQLAETDLLAGLGPRQLVDALVESMYGGDTLSGSRADRSQDDRILTAVCAALGNEVSLVRVAAGMRVLMGEPGEHLALTAAERLHIADNLFADEFKRQVHGSLRRIEAYLHPLEELGIRSQPLSGDLTCLVDESDGRSARRELLKDLIVQWLTRRVSSQELGTRSLVIVGADEISHLHLERLTELCERRDIRLVLFFRHMRDAAVQAIGGGAVCFMRLPNHVEAHQAAEFIGKQHKFLLSQLTRTLGGSDTHSVANTDGVSRSEGGSWSGGSSWDVTRNWSQTVTVADASNWSDAAAAQRVYEYAVEPRTLQDLPDYALLLVKGHGKGSVLQAVECNPDILSLSRVSMQPLPHIPLPDPSTAVIPMAGPPTHMPISAPKQMGAPGDSPAEAAQNVLPGWGNPGQPPQPR